MIECKKCFKKFCNVCASVPRDVDTGCTDATPHEFLTEVRFIFLFWFLLFSHFSLPSFFLPQKSDWEGWDEIWFARQLALFHWEMLSQIPPREFILWISSKNKVFCSFYLVLVHFFCSYFFFIRKTTVPIYGCLLVTSILLYRGQFLRLLFEFAVLKEVPSPFSSSPFCLLLIFSPVRIMEKLISIAHCSLSMNDFYGSKILLSALQHPAVSRLEKTQKKLSK